MGRCLLWLMTGGRRAGWLGCEGAEENEGDLGLALGCT